MKVKNKQPKTQSAQTPAPAKVLTENQLQEHLKNLQTQLVEAQTKVVMVQGAIQAVSLQIDEMNKVEDSGHQITNGVK
tara:strand:- start:3935 stop:4168 length:234 start_codon:yes stop_codon:yes gene_type:complete